MNLQGIKWAVKSVFHNYDAAPNPMEPWSPNVERNYRRLLEADAFGIDYYQNVNLNVYDAFLVGQFDIAQIDKEVALVKKLKEMGKKVIVAYSHDLRFHIGHALINYDSGTLYTELLKYADIILTGLPEDLHMFGRYQDKCMAVAFPLERLKAVSKPVETRPIDLLVSGSCGMQELGWTLELLLTIKERFPDKELYFSIDPAHRKTYQRYEDKIHFIPGGLMGWLQQSKFYLNPQMRPTGGRAIFESFYCRVPFISSAWNYYSKLLPQGRYFKPDTEDICNCFKLLIESDYNELVKEMEVKAEPEYFDIIYPQLVKRLFG
jgi:hypothetical protein